MLSPTGRCRAFDKGADGFVPGEGVGVIVLKRLDAAVAHGDRIYGVIRGSAVNQDGTSNGLTAPSGVSQERLERGVYDRFHIHPENIGMVEAHGTGTRLGDPIEFEALSRAFRHYTDRAGFCAIGSVKTNIGHLATAAGIAGVIKILLALQHGKIPPCLHFKEANPGIRLKKSPFYVNTRFVDFPGAEGGTRWAATSSFGFSGTNAHLVIEEMGGKGQLHGPKPGYLVVLSARTAEQLRSQAVQLLDFCSQAPETDPGNMSYTLLVGENT